jgi:hypothetical protein
MANILTHPTNGAIYFDDGTAGSSSVPALTGDAVSLNYDGSAGLNITSYNTTSTDRFSIDGDSGRLFSVNDSLTGTIFSVNDAAGLPIIEVESTSSTDTITMGTYASNALVVAGDRVGIGTASPGSSYKLDVTGDVNINGDIVLGGKLDFSGNITAATSDTDVFVVIDAGELKTRTGAQVASDIGLGNVTNESKATMFSSPSFTGTPIAPTASANTNTTQIATTEYVQTEIGELIGGAPAALDTLNELAAAIGDDASYASSITTALAAKAPLASPNFTGDVDVAGSITTEGPDGGMVMRTWTGGGSYGMIGTANMSSGEYSLLTDGTSTYLSGGTGGNVYIRGGNNDSSPQITVSGGNIGLAGVPSKASEATAIVWDGTNIGYRELGSAAFSATSAFAPATGSTSIVSLGTVVTGDWNAGVISSTYLDADTAHLSGTQTFSGAKTFSSGLNISVSTSNTQLKLKRTGTATGEFNIYTNNDSLFFNNVGQSSYPMAIDEDGNVGIGTTSPATILDLDDGTLSDIRIRGNATTDVRFAGIAFYNTAGSDTVAAVNVDRDGANDAGALTFDTQPAGGGNTERMRITSSGKVLVNGAEDNSGKADFAVSGGTVIAFRNSQVQMGGTDMNWNSKIFDDGEARWAAWDRNIEIFSTGSNTGSATARDIIFSPQTSGSAASTERMRIKGDGTVGIGTSSPSGEFHVSNTSDFFTDLDGDDSAIIFKEAGGNPWRIGNKSSDNSFRITQDVGSLNTNPRFTIANGGNVGIGVTDPDSKLEIKGSGTGGGSALKVKNSNDSELLTVADNGIVVVPNNYFYVSSSAGAYFNGNLRARGGISNDQGTLSITGDVNFDSNTMFVDSTNNRVGIGTTSAEYELHVIGTASFTDTVAGAYFEENASNPELKELDTGTILTMDEEGEIVPSCKANDTMVFGASKRGYKQPIVMGAEPIKMTGPIKVGDFITTSSRYGHGMRSETKEVGTIIAQAMESGDGDSYNIKAMIRKM